MAVIGPILATIASSLILFVVYVYFSQIYPTLTQHTSAGGLALTTMHAYALTLLGLWLLFITFFHYGATMFLSPGYPPPNNCPWVNNCVGHRNYKHFNLFCLYLALLASYFMTVAWPHVTRVMLGRHPDLSMLVACVCTVSAAIAATLFLAWNAYLTATNQTTIEFYSRMLDRSTHTAASLSGSGGKGKGGLGEAGDSNPYNMGWRSNVVAVYGPSVWRTVLLPVLTPPPGDGNFYPMNRGRGFPLKELLDGDKV